MLPGLPLTFNLLFLGLTLTFILLLSFSLILPAVLQTQALCNAYLVFDLCSLCRVSRRHVSGMASVFTFTVLFLTLAVRKIYRLMLDVGINLI